MTAKICTVELENAAKWASKHTAEVHAKAEVHPRFSIRELQSTGIFTPVVITCETCDERKVQPENSFRITCYDDI